MEKSVINLKNHLGVLVLEELEQGHTTLSQWTQVPNPDRIFAAAIWRVWEVKSSRRIQKEHWTAVNQMQEQLRRWAAECTPTFWSENEKENPREADSEPLRVHRGRHPGKRPQKVVCDTCTHPKLLCILTSKPKDWTNRDKCPGPRLAPRWNTCGTGQGSTAKKLKTQLTVEPAPTEAGLELRLNPHQADCVLNKNTNLLHKT